jgi:hypothetical protein
VLAAGTNHVKAETLKLANPALQKLHDKLATNPFTGLQQYEANRVDGELCSMKWQVEKEINKLPENDADRLRISEELKSSDARFAAYSNEWAKAGMSFQGLLTLSPHSEAHHHHRSPRGSQKRVADDS